MRLRSHRSGLIALLPALLLMAPAAAVADDDDDLRPRDGRRWWRGEASQTYSSGPCQVKTESKRGEHKREIKCPGGFGAPWRGEWKTEYSDGPCRVKQEAKRDEFKEEVQCERG